MRVPVVNIRVVRMTMGQRSMLVRVSVWSGSVDASPVGMPMMVVVHMKMLVLHRFVRMQMPVPHSQVQLDASAHQQRCRPESPMWDLRPDGECD